MRVTAREQMSTAPGTRAMPCDRASVNLCITTEPQHFVWILNREVLHAKYPTARQCAILKFGKLLGPRLNIHFFHPFSFLFHFSWISLMFHESSLYFNASPLHESSCNFWMPRQAWPRDEAKQQQGMAWQPIC